MSFKTAMNHQRLEMSKKERKREKKRRIETKEGRVRSKTNAQQRNDRTTGERKRWHNCQEVVGWREDDEWSERLAVGG